MFHVLFVKFSGDICGVLQHLDDIWELLDVDGSGYLDYGEFMRGVIGEMSESRKALVRKVKIT